MYVYPLEFESQLISRKALVKNSFYAVILFQIGMIGLGTLGDGILDRKTTVHMLTFVLVQFVTIFVVFEFMRSPWEGVEIELERVLELQQHKILEDSISVMTMQNIGNEGHNEEEWGQNDQKDFS